MSWTPSAVGNYEISVWVDPSIPPGGGWGDILEAIETNNIATELMQVGADLSIDFTDISFSENPIQNGTMVTITAVIHNNGGEDANDVVVNFYDHEIKNKYLIYTTTISTIEAGNSTTITITWDTSEAEFIGYHSIWVVIDPDPPNDIEEYDEENNEAYNVLNIT
jgi:subtilase family serine protease